MDATKHTISISIEDRGDDYNIEAHIDGKKEMLGFAIIDTMNDKKPFASIILAAVMNYLQTHEDERKMMFDLLNEKI